MGEAKDVGVTLEVWGMMEEGRWSSSRRRRRRRATGPQTTRVRYGQHLVLLITSSRVMKHDAVSYFKPPPHRRRNLELFD